MALTVVSQIFPREMIPAVLPLIEDKLQHSKYVLITEFQMALYNWVINFVGSFSKLMFLLSAGLL